MHNILKASLQRNWSHPKTVNLSNLFPPALPHSSRHIFCHMDVAALQHRHLQWQLNFHWDLQYVLGFKCWPNLQHSRFPQNFLSILEFFKTNQNWPRNFNFTSSTKLNPLVYSLGNHWKLQWFQIRHFKKFKIGISNSIFVAFSTAGWKTIW